MSFAPLAVILDRIKHAEESSPIAVFWKTEISEQYGRREGLNAVFANTVRTKAIIKITTDTLIGVFHSGQNINEVKQTLVTAERKRGTKNGGI